MKTEQIQLDFDEAYEKFMKFWRSRKEKLVQQATRARSRKRPLTRPEGGGQPRASGRQARRIGVEVAGAEKRHAKIQEKKAKDLAQGKRYEDLALKEIARYNSELIEMKRAVAGGATAQELANSKKQMLRYARNIATFKKRAAELGYHFRINIKLEAPPTPKPPRKKVSPKEEMRQQLRQSQAQMSLARAVVANIREHKEANHRAITSVKRHIAFTKALDDQKMYEVERGKAIFVSIMNTVESLYQSKKYNQADKKMREAHIVLTAMQSWMPVVPKIPALTDYSDTSTKLKRQP